MEYFLFFEQEKPKCYQIAPRVNNLASLLKRKRFLNCSTFSFFWKTLALRSTKAKEMSFLFVTSVTSNYSVLFWEGIWSQRIWTRSAFNWFKICAKATI